MRPPRSTPLLLALLALAVPAGAQNKTGAAAETAANGKGQAGASLGAHGVAPIGGALLTPLTLSPGSPAALSAPSLSLDQGLAPVALAAARPAAAVAQAEPPRQAANAVPAANGAPYYLRSLAKLGVPAPLAGRLESFLSARHPGEHDKIYHGPAHSREVADLIALIADGPELAAEKKILLILAAALHDVDPGRAANAPPRVPATLAHLDSDDEARGLLMDFGTRYGFTAAQVKALISATDFDQDPAAAQRLQAAFAKAARDSFPAEPDWALNWGRRLAFADQASTYVQSVDYARKRVEGFALEKRTERGGSEQDDAAIRAGTYKFLTVLKQNPLFALLPPAQSAVFDAVRASFDPKPAPQAWMSESAPARAPPANPDLAAVRRYINGIMGGTRAPTEREIDSLLGDWLDEKDIPRNSARAAQVRLALLPGKYRADANVAAALHPSLRRHSALLIRIAADRKITVPQVESVIIQRGLLQYIADIPVADLETQIETALTKAELESAVSAYPDNEQGELMRSVAYTMGISGGKSVEEISRDGVFLYADFTGSRFLRGYASRDPDIQSHTIAFYVTRKDGRWSVGGYRQKKGQSGTSDAVYIDAFKSWLRAGGIPASDLHD